MRARERVWVDVCMVVYRSVLAVAYEHVRAGVHAPSVPLRSLLLSVGEWMCA